MVLEMLPHSFTVCKLLDGGQIDWNEEYLFLGKTEFEVSLVCRTKATPSNAYQREDGYVGLRVQGQLDFSLTGILSPIAAILAEAKIPIFVVSTYDTDYIFIKESTVRQATYLLEQKGYRIQK